jgi:HlyD family secretion protein
MRRVFLVLITLGMGPLSGAQQPPSVDSLQAAEPTAVAGRGNPEKKVTALGTVEPEQVVDVCAQVTGKIARLGVDAQGKPIDYGSSVEAGAVLAQIDNELYVARVEREQAGCARAEAELAQAMIHLERAAAQWQHAQEQQKNKALADSDFDLAKLNHKAAEASVRVAQAALLQCRAAVKQAEIELSYTAIKSPLSGVVIDRRVNVGQVVSSPSVPSLFLIAADLNKLQVWVSVAEADIVRVRQQQPVRFTVGAFPGQVFEGKVTQIRLNATMAQNMVAYTVVVAISHTERKLLPYLTAHVEFQ